MRTRLTVAQSSLPAQGKGQRTPLRYSYDLDVQPYAEITTLRNRFRCFTLSQRARGPLRGEQEEKRRNPMTPSCFPA